MRGDWGGSNSEKLNMRARTLGLLLFCFYSLKAQLPVYQFPGLVEVEAGGTVRLQCDISGLAWSAYCYTVLWTRIHRRTRKMITSTDHAAQDSEVCSFNIHKATVDDSGTYYCSAANGRMVFIGNGSTVIVRKEKSTAPPPIEILWSSDRIHRHFVPLMCLAFGVVPQQAHVFWVVDGDEKSGLTESIWTKDGDAIIESTQNQVLVPAEVWQRGALCTCVVGFYGRNTSKSVQREESSDVCAVLLYGAIAGLALIVAISIAVFLLRGSRRSRSRPVADALDGEVVYATLDQDQLRRPTNIVLH